MSSDHAQVLQQVVQTFDQNNRRMRQLRWPLGLVALTNVTLLVMQIVRGAPMTDVIEIVGMCFLTAGLFASIEFAIHSSAFAVATIKRSPAPSAVPFYADRRVLLGLAVAAMLSMGLSTYLVLINDAPTSTRFFRLALLVLTMVFVGKSIRSYRTLPKQIGQPLVS